MNNEQKPQRLRVFDWSNSYFWIVIFYQRLYGKPIIELSIYKPSLGVKWFHFWKWENVPDLEGARAFIRTTVNPDITKQFECSHDYNRGTLSKPITCIEDIFPNGVRNINSDDYKQSEVDKATELIQKRKEAHETGMCTQCYVNKATLSYGIDGPHSKELLFCSFKCTNEYAMTGIYVMRTKAE